MVMQIWPNYISPVLSANPFGCYGSQWIQCSTERKRVRHFAQRQSLLKAGSKTLLVCTTSTGDQKVVLLSVGQGLKPILYAHGCVSHGTCMGMCSVVVLGTQRYESANLLLPINKALLIQLPSYQPLITTYFLPSFPSQHVLTYCATKPVRQEI